MYVYICIDPTDAIAYSLSRMREKDTDKTGTWIIRDVPADLMRRTRMGVIAENTTVRELFIALAEAHLKELEKKGLLPKGK